MGLDMYLNKRTYLGAQYDFNQIDGMVDIQRKNRPVNINFKRITYIEEEMGYWRKANAIHKWFVDNVQNGKDDCNDYYVDVEELKKLRDMIQTILKAKGKKRENLALKLLPPYEGFFFGNTDIDKYYFEDLEYTVNLINKVESENEEANENNISVKWIYQSSW